MDDLTHLQWEEGCRVVTSFKQLCIMKISQKRELFFSQNLKLTKILRTKKMVTYMQ